MLPLDGIFFQSGDSRTNENIILTTIHTIFLRFHNRICDEIADQQGDLDLSDQEIYNMARNYVTGVWQNIVFEEYLPLLLG